jgi:hypothetical protein
MGGTKASLGNSSPEWTLFVGVAMRAETQGGRLLGAVLPVPFLSGLGRCDLCFDCIASAVWAAKVAGVISSSLLGVDALAV